MARSKEYNHGNRMYKRGSAWWGYIDGERVSLHSQDHDTALVEYNRLSGGGTRQKDLRFDAAVKEYLQSERFVQLAQTTQARRQWSFDKKIVPYFRIRPIKKIKAPEVYRYIDARQREKAASNSILSETAALSAMFQYCVEMGYVDFNPVRLVDKKPSKTDLVRPHYTPSEDEINRVIANLYSGSMTFFLALSNTGARRAELSNTNVQDFDRDLGTLRLIRKGGKEDIICLNDFLKNRIEDDLIKRRMQRDVLPTEPLFLNQCGRTRLLDINYAIASACKRAGVPHMSHHCIRHGYATVCYEQGMQPTDVANLLGNSLQVCMDIYIKWQNAKKKQLARTITFGSVPDVRTNLVQTAKATDVPNR